MAFGKLSFQEPGNFIVAYKDRYIKKFDEMVPIAENGTKQLCDSRPKNKYSGNGEIIFFNLILCIVLLHQRMLICTALMIDCMSFTSFPFASLSGIVLALRSSEQLNTLKFPS